MNDANPSRDCGPGGDDQPLADTLSIVYDLRYGTAAGGAAAQGG